jgi:hypothetical protein
VNTIPEPYGTVTGNPIMDDAVWTEFEKRYPDIRWREPEEVRSFSGAAGLGCRICMGRFGLMGYNIQRLPQTVGQFAKHMEEFHP